MLHRYPRIVGWNNLNKPNRYNFRTSFLINHVHGSFIYVTSSWSLVIVLGTVPKFDPWCSATQVNAIFESHMLLVKGSGAVLPPKNMVAETSNLLCMIFRFPYFWNGEGKFWVSKVFVLVVQSGGKYEKHPVTQKKGRCCLIDRICIGIVPLLQCEARSTCILPPTKRGAENQHTSERESGRPTPFSKSTRANRVAILHRSLEAG